jgi:hypothetical protein
MMNRRSFFKRAASLAALVVVPIAGSKPKQSSGYEMLSGKITEDAYQPDLSLQRTEQALAMFGKFGSDPPTIAALNHDAEQVNAYQLTWPMIDESPQLTLPCWHVLNSATGHVEYVPFTDYTQRANWIIVGASIRGDARAAGRTPRPYSPEIPGRAARSAAT